MSRPLSHQALDTVVLEELEGSEHGELRVLVVRLSAMGDVIHGIPAITALHAARPNLKIGWLIEQRWMELLCAHSTERLQPRSELKPLVDWVHISDFKGWRKELSSGVTWNEMRGCMNEVRALKYDIAIDLQGAIRSATAARLSGAKARIGSAEPREKPARRFYTNAVATPGAHVVEHALSLASAVAGEELNYQEPEFPQDDATEGWADRFCASSGFAPLAIVNPGAGWGAKCWPAESYGAIAKALAARGMAVMVNYGPEEEPLAQAVREASEELARPVKCSVSQLIAVTRRASLFIGGDTGPMHLAAALGVPVVALFGPTRPDRNGPYATRSVVLRSPGSVDNMSHVDQLDTGLQAIT
ncbi:MAG TPA: glycosyltransferase family 9 protein, partial [Candidatus Angelobacter sp.]|nr:glycosyltransferase family 9 protein [Candidatus Angelobacter sp.]